MSKHVTYTAVNEDGSVLTVDFLKETDEQFKKEAADRKLKEHQDKAQEWLNKKHVEMLYGPHPGILNQIAAAEKIQYPQITEEFFKDFLDKLYDSNPQKEYLWVISKQEQQEINEAIEKFKANERDNTGKA